MTDDINIDDNPEEIAAQVDEGDEIMLNISPDDMEGFGGVVTLYLLDMITLDEAREVVRRHLNLDKEGGSESS
jgi:hypothetical protein